MIIQATYQWRKSMQREEPKHCRDGNVQQCDPMAHGDMRTKDVLRVRVSVSG